jgi:DNA-binding transcriptional LysR family regulator
MNVHHLELFYFVARHGGISEAARRMPYGIQQPAISGQVAQLEEFLGVKLFTRRPFALTPEGEKLYRFIEPFFSKLDAVAGEFQGGRTQRIRIGASEIVLRDYLPDMLRNVRGKFPGIKLTLREGYQPTLEGWLAKDELDLAITLIEKKPAAGIRSLPLLELPLVLVAPRNSRLRSPEQLWQLDKIEEPLICLPPEEPICKHFQDGLRRLGVDWFPRIETTSLDLIETYVANGFGIGLSVAHPVADRKTHVRRLRLPDFEPVVVGVLWKGKPAPVAQALIDELQRQASA